MTEESTGDRSTEGRPSVDKAVVKEALTELLDEIPAFRALKAQPGPSSQLSSDPPTPPQQGE